MSDTDTDTGPDSVRLALAAASSALRDAVHVYSMTPTADLPPAPDLSEQVGDLVDTMRKASALLGHLHRAVKGLDPAALRSDDSTPATEHLGRASGHLDDATGQIGALLEDLDDAHNALSHLAQADDPTDDLDVP